MLRFLARRLVFALLLVLVASSASFVLMGAAPGDYATATFGTTGRAGTVEQTRTRLGLAGAPAQQYRAWLAGAARLDFGRSFAYDRPVTDLVPERAWNTALLASTALLFATLAGLSLGTLTGSRSGGWVPRLVRGASLALLSTPPFLTSLFLVFLAARSQFLPVGGMRSPDVGAGVLDLAKHMIVPVLALALPIAAMFERLQAQAMRETMEQRFVLASHARGVPVSRIIWRGAMKASLRSVAAVYGVAVASLFSGSFAVEMVTAWPGLGRLMFDALRARDLYLVAGCAAAGAIFLAVGSLLSDAALVSLDARAGE